MTGITLKYRWLGVAEKKFRDSCKAFYDAGHDLDQATQKFYQAQQEQRDLGIRYYALLEQYNRRKEK